uniref:Uncharacterized protein n=1 Tax=viral metagenome TaxID=1070528 RepID=A0A6C0H787_9ZZZZ
MDNLINDIIDIYYSFLNENNFFKNIINDANFIKKQILIVETVNNFIKNKINKNMKELILNIITNDSHYNIFINIFVYKYCIIYIYLGIAYYYKDSKDLYISNLIDSSQTDILNTILTSSNISNIINYYIDIQNMLELFSIKNFDKIKIILSNNVIKYNSIIKLFNILGENYIIDYLMIDNNFHNIIKTLIFKLLYLIEDKKDILSIITPEGIIDNIEYKYIEILVSNEKKIINLDFIEKFLNLNKLSIKWADEIYEYLNNYYILKENNNSNINNCIDYLFNNKIIIPIVEDFVRYHKDTEIYLKDTIIESDNIKLRNLTKIKYIINKMNNIRNYHSPILIDYKLKLNIKNLFYKQYENRLAVLYNDNEEIKIIQKIQNIDYSADYELLIDLENIRNYAYNNFKHFSKHGISMKFNNTITAIRYTNINDKNKQLIETRISNEKIPVNIIGIAYTGSNKFINLMNTSTLININSLKQFNSDNKDNQNGFINFNKILPKKSNKLIYWLFNLEKDKILINKYINYNTDDSDTIIKLMLQEIFNNYIKLINNKLINYIDKLNNMTFYDLNKIIHIYDNIYFNLYPELKNEIISYIILEKIPQLKIEQDANDNKIYSYNPNMIKLPTIEVEYNSSDEELYDENIITHEYNPDTSICYHYIKWKEILKLSKNTEEFSQAIYDFAKQYLKSNNQGMNVCKSCNELLDITKFIYSGTYIEELNTFITTSIIINQNLETISKYSTYTRTIKNIERIIERISQIMNNTVYLGNDIIIKSRRRMLIKDIIDIILIHTNWLKNHQRNMTYYKNFGINKELTELFHFELKDDIFIINTSNIDHYKIIKYNNIIVYIIFILIIELTEGQIIFIRNNKIFNYKLFLKIQHSLFNNLFLRLNKDKIALNKLPLFCFILYYYSGIVVNNKIWLYNLDDNIKPKEKIVYIIQTQKIVIHTLLDLFNTIIEANLEDNKNYLYEIINNKFYIKIHSLFNNINLLNKNQEFNNKTYDIKENNISNKIEYIIISTNNTNNFNNIINTDYCFPETIKLENRNFKTNNTITELTTCPSGNFHKWQFEANDLICLECNKSYNQINKNNKEFNTDIYFDKLKSYHLKQLATKYCLDGSLHEIPDKNNICLKCHINISNIDNEYLNKYTNNLNNINNKKIIKYIDYTKKYNNKIKNKEKKIKSFINKIILKYNKYSNNKLEIYITQFIQTLISIVGEKVKINNDDIYLNETIIILNHDYKGNILNKNIIKKLIDFTIINKQIGNTMKNIMLLKENNMYLYYDLITFQYIGYSENNKNIIFVKNNIILTIKYSIYDCILLWGYEYKYINIYNNEINSHLINDIIRNRIINLKKILLQIKIIISSIKNNIVTSKHPIISEFIKNIKKMHIITSKKIFKNFKYIINNLFINYNIDNIENLVNNTNIDTNNISTVKLIINNNYLDVMELIKYNNYDCHIIFYILYNFNIIIDSFKKIKDDSNIITEISIMIIKIIYYMFNIYYKFNMDKEIRRLDYILINEPSYMDNSLKIYGYYQELLTDEEVNDINNNDEACNAIEEFNTFDIDEFDGNNDDIIESLGHNENYD